MKRNNIFGKIIVIIFSLVVILPILPPFYVGIYGEIYLAFTLPSGFLTESGQQSYKDEFRADEDLCIKYIAISDGGCYFHCYRAYDCEGT